MGRLRDKRERRKRVSASDVRRNAQKGVGASLLALPPGVEEWAPQKPGTFRLDVLPYLVSDKKHPDGVKPGFLWYKREYTIHHGIGANNQSRVCPLSVGRPCPIHEERERLKKKDYEKNEKTIKQLKGKVLVAFNIRHPDDPKKVAVFRMSWGNFWGGDAGLKSVLEHPETDEATLNFFDTEGGQTILARFKEDSYEGRKYLKCVRIDFEERKDLDEDRILAKTVNLDEMLIVPSYDELKALFLGEEGDDADEDDEEKPRSRRSRSRDEDEDDEDEDDADEDDADEDDADEDEDDEDDADEDEDDEDDEDADERPTRRSKKSRSGKDPKGAKKKCPEGGRFGRDFGKFEGCDECPLFSKCLAANKDQTPF